MSRRVLVRVPGVTATLPDGEIAAVAIDRWLDASIVTRVEPGIVVERGGTFASLRTPAEQDPFVAAFRATCERAGRVAPDGLTVRVVSRIPVARGLGAAVAATVAGVVAADALLDLRLGEDTVVHIAADVHGAEPRIVAALHGGASPAPRGGVPAASAHALARSLVVATVDDSAGIGTDGEELARAAGALRAVVVAKRTILALAVTDDAPCVAARLDGALRMRGAAADVFVNPARVRGHEHSVRHVCDDEPLTRATSLAAHP
jgi:homoserine kinase